jgi:hypothetical protein
MIPSFRSRRLAAKLPGLLLFVPALLLLASCHDSDQGPTAPPSGATATLQGTVVLGSGSAQLRQRSGIGLGGVTVHAVGTNRSATTDGSGHFSLTEIPAGSVELEFDRADIHARGQVVLTSGSHSMTFAIVGARAVPTPGGHAGEEIEGLVQAIDPGAGTLTVLDQRLGAVRVVADGDTLVRRGDASIPLSQIAVGMRVHVKALAQDDGTYLATEILLQNENVGGMREVSGSVASVDSGAGSFVVDAGGTSIVVETDGHTDYKKRGGPASFADVIAGASVEVKGILQADGHVLARKVQIES